VNFKAELLHLSNIKFDRRTPAVDFNLLSSFFTFMSSTSTAQVDCGHVKMQMIQMVQQLNIKYENYIFCVHGTVPRNSMSINVQEDATLHNLFYL